MKKILVVDDEEDMVDLLVDLLDDGRKELLTAYDGEEALEIVRSERPDLVLSDVMMPHLDGRELCRRIKAEPATLDIPIILMSAADLIDPEQYGAEELVRKPFNIAYVRSAVDRYLDRAG